MKNQVKQDDLSNLDTDRLEELLERANNGEESVVLEIRGLLANVPEFVQALGGDLAHDAERALVRAIAGKNIAQREAIFKKMARLRAELAGPNPQPLERLLVERVALCWLHAYYADCQYAHSARATLEQGEYLQRQQDRTQRRYLAAIKCLAAVRRLALPINLHVRATGSLDARSAAPICLEASAVLTFLPKIGPGKVRES